MMHDAAQLASSPLMAAIVTSLGLKTALVLVTAGSLHATVTPPRPIGEVQQYDTDDKGEKAFVGTAVAVKHPTRVIQTLLWSAAAAELYSSWTSTDIPSTVTAWTVVGATLSACGGALRIWCYRILGNRFTFELATHSHQTVTSSLLPTLATDSIAPAPPSNSTQHDPASHSHPFPLVTTGPYSVVRHPSYIAACMAFHGACILFLAPGSTLSFASRASTRSPLLLLGQALALLLACSPVVSLPRRIRKEEQMLREEFGEEWELYARTVRWRMIPGIY